VEAARVAYESIADQRQEAAATLRMSCAQVMAHSYLAPILPGFLAQHPKVDLVLEAKDRALIAG
jgi:DNA-binding transcriptional LysR family regulator